MATKASKNPNEATPLLPLDTSFSRRLVYNQHGSQKKFSFIWKKTFWVLMATTTVICTTYYACYSSPQGSLFTSIYHYDRIGISSLEDTVEEIEGKKHDKKKKEKEKEENHNHDKKKKEKEKEDCHKHGKKKKGTEKEENHNQESIKKKTKSYNKDAMSECEEGYYSKTTLKKAYELPFASLFVDNRGQKKYEASSVFIVDNDAYAVCDNSWAISKFSTNLQPFTESNIQVGDPDRVPDEDSGYEAIFYDNGNYYVVRESVLLDGVNHTDLPSYHAVIEKLSMNADDYDVLESCSSEYEFEGDSKGFEGAISIRNKNNELVVLGLCEGNYCSEKRKFEKGNGRLVAMRYEKVDDGSGVACRWSTIRIISLPKSAYFRDYSDISMDANGRVIITSQEESQIWIGQLRGQVPAYEQMDTNASLYDLFDVKDDVQASLWDIDNVEFDENQGVIYDFPKNDNCETVYCNIEGVDWLNSEMIIAVSDKMKSKGKQDFRCFDKDQSVHVFVLP